MSNITKLFKNTVLKSDNNRKSFDEALKIKEKHNSNPTVGHKFKMLIGRNNKYSSKDYSNLQQKFLKEYDNLKKNPEKQAQLKKSDLSNKAKFLNNIGEMKNNFQRINTNYLNTISSNKINKLKKIIELYKKLKAMETKSMVYNSKEQKELKLQINDLKKCLTEYMMNYSSGEQQFQEFKNSIQIRYQQDLSTQLEKHKCPKKNSMREVGRIFSQATSTGLSTLTSKITVDPCISSQYKLTQLEIDTLKERTEEVYYPLGKF